MAHEKPNDHADHTGATDDTGATEPAGSVPYEGGAEPHVEDSATAEAVPVSVGPRPGGFFSAETFGLTALLLLAVTIMTGQLIEIFTNLLLIGGQAIPVEQVAQLNIQLLVGGVLCLITALTAVLALVLADAGTRPWARWAGAAALIISLLLVIVAVISYLLVPAGVEQQMPTFPQ